MKQGSSGGVKFITDRHKEPFSILRGNECIDIIAFFHFLYFIFFFIFFKRSARGITSSHIRVGCGGLRVPYEPSQRRKMSRNGLR
jgi:hypothetical protein